MKRPCVYCGDSVDPAAASTWRRIVGWERKASAESRRSGSDIAARTQTDFWACDPCVQRLKRGLNPTQQELLG